MLISLVIADDEISLPLLACLIFLLTPLFFHLGTLLILERRHQLRSALTFCLVGHVALLAFWWFGFQPFGTQTLPQLALTLLALFIATEREIGKDRATFFGLMISVASFLLTLSLIGFYQLISNHFQGTRYDANGINLVGLLDLQDVVAVAASSLSGGLIWFVLFGSVYSICFFISLFIFRRYLPRTFLLAKLALAFFLLPFGAFVVKLLPHQNNISQLFFPTKLVWNYYAAAPVYHHPLGNTLVHLPCDTTIVSVTKDHLSCDHGRLQIRFSKTVFPAPQSYPDWHTLILRFDHQPTTSPLSNEAHFYVDERTSCVRIVKDLPTKDGYLRFEAQRCEATNFPYNAEQHLEAIELPLLQRVRLENLGE